MGNFEDQIARFIEETQTQINETLQTIVLKIGRELVTLSPVDTGRFKGNWQLSIGTGSGNSLVRQDKEGFVTLSEIASKVNSFTAGQIAYLQNHVLYGHDLEFGSSSQAPDGIVRITEQRFARIVSEAIALHR